MKNNFFAIDIGNTDIVVALIRNYKIHKIKRVKTIDFIKKKIFLFKNFNEIKKVLKLQNEIPSIICSVVPNINYNIKKVCVKNLKCIPNFISYKETKLNVKIDLKNKNQVGADRLANTVAVKSLYRTPAVIIDFGTATTFDVINDSGNYEGGVITPGINLSLDNLFKKTSQLPLVKLRKNKNVIGKNTKNAIENGLYWGYIGLVTFLINKIQSKFKKKLFCISTGGLSRFISKDIKLITTTNENLTIQGLIEIFKINNCEKYVR